MDYQFAFYLLLVLSLTIIVWQAILIFSMRDAVKMLDKVMIAYQKERADLLDRLMSQDIRELKLAQKMEDRTDKPKVVSKHSNNKRIMEEKAKISQ